MRIRFNFARCLNGQATIWSKWETVYIESHLKLQAPWKRQYFSFLFFQAHAQIGTTAGTVSVLGFYFHTY